MFTISQIGISDLLCILYDYSPYSTKAAFSDYMNIIREKITGTSFSSSRRSFLEWMNGSRIPQPQNLNLDMCRKIFENLSTQQISDYRSLYNLLDILSNYNIDTSKFTSELPESVSILENSEDADIKTEQLLDNLIEELLTAAFSNKKSLLQEENEVPLKSKSDLPLSKSTYLFEKELAEFINYVYVNSNSPINFFTEEPNFEIIDKKLLNIQSFIDRDNRYTSDILQIVNEMRDIYHDLVEVCLCIYECGDDLKEHVMTIDILFNPHHFYCLNKYAESHNTKLDFEKYFESNNGAITVMVDTLKSPEGTEEFINMIFNTPQILLIKMKTSLDKLLNTLNQYLDYYHIKNK